MTKQQAENRARLFERLADLGFNYSESEALIRIERTLQRWGELECGNGNDYGSWAIERDDDNAATCTQCGEKWFGESATAGNCPKCGDCAPIRRIATGKPFMVRHSYRHGRGADTVTRSPIADREKGALKRLTSIMAGKEGLQAYHQGDCRGCNLYIVRTADLNGRPLDSCYTVGVAVCY